MRRIEFFHGSQVEARGMKKDSKNRMIEQLAPVDEVSERLEKLKAFVAEESKKGEKKHWGRFGKRMEAIQRGRALRNIEDLIKLAEKASDYTEKQKLVARAMIEAIRFGYAETKKVKDDNGNKAVAVVFKEERSKKKKKEKRSVQETTDASPSPIPPAPSPTVPASETLTQASRTTTDDARVDETQQYTETVDAGISLEEPEIATSSPIVSDATEVAEEDAAPLVSPEGGVYADSAVVALPENKAEPIFEPVAATAPTLGDTAARDMSTEESVQSVPTDNTDAEEETKKTVKVDSAELNANLDKLRESARALRKDDMGESDQVSEIEAVASENKDTATKDESDDESDDDEEIDSEESKKLQQSIDELTELIASTRMSHGQSRPKEENQIVIETAQKKLQEETEPADASIASIEKELVALVEKSKSSSEPSEGGVEAPPASPNSETGELEVEAWFKKNLPEVKLDLEGSTSLESEHEAKLKKAAQLIKEKVLPLLTELREGDTLQLTFSQKLELARLDIQYIVPGDLPRQTQQAVIKMWLYDDASVSINCFTEHKWLGSQMSTYKASYTKDYLRSLTGIERLIKRARGEISPDLQILLESYADEFLNAHQAFRTMDDNKFLFAFKQNLYEPLSSEASRLKEQVSPTIAALRLAIKEASYIDSFEKSLLEKHITTILEKKLAEKR